MEFTKIQHKDTNEIIQYRINGERVSERRYKDEHFRQINVHNRVQTCFFTDRTRTGNFRHRFYTSGLN